MQIITASNAKYMDILRMSLYNNSLVGYQPFIYDINSTLGMGSPIKVEEPNPAFRGRGISPYKPDIILDSIEKFLPHHKTIIWMDADAFAISPLDEIDEDDDFDLGVTIRTEEETKSITSKTKWIKNAFNQKMAGNKNPMRSIILHTAEWRAYINAGVIFVKPRKNTENLIKFIHLWKKTIPELPFNSDQNALTNLLLRHSELLQPNEVFEAYGIRVKTFSTKQYNFFYENEKPLDSTKILHLKAAGRKGTEKFLHWKDGTQNERLIRISLPKEI